MVALPYLPQETIAGIIGLLTEDTQSLCSCSLVSTDWVHRACICLFTSVQLCSLNKLQTFPRSMRHSHYVSFLHLEDSSKWITPDTLQAISTSCPNFVDSHRFDTELGRAPLRLHFSETEQPHARQPYNGESLDILPKSRHLSSLMRQVDPVEDQRQVCALYDCSICASSTYCGSQRGAVKDCGFRILQPLKDLLAAYHQMVNVFEVSYTYDCAPHPFVNLSPLPGLGEVSLPLINHLSEPHHWVEAILQIVTTDRLRKITCHTRFRFELELCSYPNSLGWSRLNNAFREIANTLEGPDEKPEPVLNPLSATSTKFDPIAPPQVLGKLSDKGHCQVPIHARFPRRYCIITLVGLCFHAFDTLSTKLSGIPAVQNNASLPICDDRNYKGGTRSSDMDLGLLDDISKFLEGRMARLETGQHEGFWRRCCQGTQKKNPQAPMFIALSSFFYI